MVLGAIVGALVPRSSTPGQTEHRRRSAQTSARAFNTTSSRDAAAARPEWNRLRDGLLGLLADRALVVAQDFLERVTDRAPVSSHHTP